MTTNKSEQISIMASEARVEAEVGCSTCLEKEYGYDEYDAACGAYISGFRLVDGGIYCKDCVRKLKYKNKLMKASATCT